MTSKNASSTMKSRALPHVDGAAEPKVGLLFLVCEDVHQPELWENYISEASARVSVYCHAKFPQEIRLPPLAGHLIHEHHETWWGHPSLVAAMLALLRAAMEDSDLTHFVFLSETCIPIRPAAELIELLITDGRSRFPFIDIDEASRTHPDKAVRFDNSPGIPHAHRHFQPQWVLLNRQAASTILVNDCLGAFEQVVVADESYFSTVLSMAGWNLHHDVANTHVTWCRWSPGAWHPDSFGTISEELAEEWSHSGCFFARKAPRERLAWQLPEKAPRAEIRLVQKISPERFLILARKVGEASRSLEDSLRNFGSVEVFPDQEGEGGVRDPGCAFDGYGGLTCEDQMGAWARAMHHLSRTLSKGERIWFIEENIAGNQAYFADLIAKTREIDPGFAAWDIHSQKEDSGWSHWHLVEGILERPWKAFMPLCRMDWRLISEALEFRRHHGKFAYIEALFPTLAKELGLECLDWNRRGADFNHLFGEFRYRPHVERVQDGVSHPVKDPVVHAAICRSEGLPGTPD